MQREWLNIELTVCATKEKCDDIMSGEYFYVFFFFVVFSPIYKIIDVFFCFVTGDLEVLKKQAFVLKEGVEYKIKISFKVSISALNIIIIVSPFCIEFATPHFVFSF